MIKTIPQVIPTGVMILLLRRVTITLRVLVRLAILVILIVRILRFIFIRHVMLSRLIMRIVLAVLRLRTLLPARLIQMQRRIWKYG